MMRMAIALTALVLLQACGDSGTSSSPTPDTKTPGTRASSVREPIIAMLPEQWVDGIVAMGQGERQDYWLRLAASMRIDEYVLTSDSAAAPLRTNLKGLLVEFEKDLPPLTDPRYPSGAFKESKAHVWEVLRSNRR